MNNVNICFFLILIFFNCKAKKQGRTRRSSVALRRVSPCLEMISEYCLMIIAKSSIVGKITFMVKYQNLNFFNKWYEIKGLYGNQRCFRGAAQKCLGVSL